MKSKIGVLIFVSALALFSSCRKDDPAVTAGTPVFSVNGTLDGNPLRIEAGVAGYYMHTGVASDPNDVYVFSGTFADENCQASCPNSLRMEIRDYATHSNSQTLITNSLHSGTYQFADSLLSSNSNTIMFTADARGDQVLSALWTFGDGDSSTVLNPVHTYANAGNYNVCLTVNYMHNNTFQSSSICDMIMVGSVPCMTVDMATLGIGVDSFFGIDSVLFTGLVSGGTQPYIYTWNFGDSSNGSGSQVIHPYGGSGEYTVTLSVLDAQSCNIQRKRNIPTTGSNGALTNFNWMPDTSSGLNLSKVRVIWTDASGNNFASDAGPQPASSSFQVLSVDDYDVNENGLPTKKIHAVITCTLYGPTGSIVLSNANVIFAVAYPN